MEDPEAKEVDEVVEKIEETVIELLVEALEVEKVEEPVVESTVEAVPDKAAEEVDEVVEKIEETVVESIVEAITDKAAEEADEVVVEENAAGLKRLKKKTEQNFLSKSETREVRAGGARKILEAEEIAEKADEVIEFEETVVENAAVLERLEKNGAKFFI